MNTKFCFQSRRAGWSIFQVLAFLLALAAGVWLGARYLEVPVEDLAHTALDEAKVLEKLPKELRPAPRPGLVKDPEQVANELQQDLDVLQSEVAKLQTSKEAPAESGAAAKTQPGKVRSEAQSTLEYWNGLRKIVAQVKQIDVESEHAVDELNAGQVLKIRSTAYRFATKAISALPTSDVDPQAIEFGQSLVNWYGKGVDLYETSLSVWRGELDGQKGLGGAEGLAASRQQFDQQAALLRVKGAELNQRLKRRLGIEFPPVGL